MSDYLEQSDCDGNMRSSFEEEEIDTAGGNPRKKRGRPSHDLTAEQRKKNKIERDRRDRAKKKAEFERLQMVELEYKEMVLAKTKAETEEQKAVLEGIHSGVNQEREQLKVNLERAKEQKGQIEKCWNRIANTKTGKEIIEQAGNDQGCQILPETSNRRVNQKEKDDSIIFSDPLGQIEDLDGDLTDLLNDCDGVGDNQFSEMHRAQSPQWWYELEKHFPPKNMEEGDVSTALKDTQAQAGFETGANAVAQCEQGHPYQRIGLVDHNEYLYQLETNNIQCANVSMDALRKWCDGINEAASAGHNVDFVRSHFELAAKTHQGFIEEMRRGVAAQREAELAKAQNELRQHEEAAKKAQEEASLAEKQAEETRARVAALGGKITRLDTTQGRP